MDTATLLIWGLGGICVIGIALAALAIAGFGVWRSATSDYLEKRDEVLALRRELAEREREYERELAHQIRDFATQEREFERRLEARDLEIQRLRERLWQRAEERAINVIQAGSGAQLGQSGAGRGITQEGDK